MRAQSLPDWEMLLVDDGSTDGSAGARRARSPPASRGSGCSGWAREPRRGGGAQRRHPRGARPLPRLPRRRRPLAPGEARGAARLHGARPARRFVLRRLPADRRRRPAARRRARCRRGSTHARAAQGQRHRLPDRGLRHGAFRQGRDAAAAPPPGLRALADAARPRRRGARAAGGARRLPGAAGLALGRQARRRRRRPGRLYREVAGLGRARAGYYLAHNLARGVAKRLG